MVTTAAGAERVSPSSNPSTHPPPHPQWLPPWRRVMVSSGCPLCHRTPRAETSNPLTLTHFFVLCICNLAPEENLLWINENAL